MNKNIKKPEYLYKYISFEQFVSLIETEQLYLTKITSWEDCYEGYFFKQFKENSILDLLNKMKTKNQKNSACPIDILNKIRPIIIDAYANSFYGQSWIYDYTKSEDAMWRIYSPNKTGVRIKISLTNIYNQINLLMNSDDRLSELDDDFINYDKDKPSNTHEAVFMKRSEFSHEHEYRFVLQLFCGKDKNFIKEYNKAVNTYETPEKFKSIVDNLFINYSYPSVLYYDLLNDMIEEAVLDPRAPGYFEKTFNTYCKNKGLKNYSKSKLYKIED